MLREHAGDCFVPPGTGPLPSLTDLAGPGLPLLRSRLT
jgi:hypothetical protein